MICFLSKIAVRDLQALVVHYKIIHLLKPNSAYNIDAPRTVSGRGLKYLIYIYFL